MVAKRLLAALIVLMLAVSSFAVDAYYGARMGMGINLSRYAGDKASDYKKSMDDADMKWSNGASFDFAPFFLLQLADPFALQTEMFFTNFGAGQVDKDGNGWRYSYRTIIVPVLAKVTLLERKLGIFAGPHFHPTAARYVDYYDNGDKKDVWKSAGQSVGLTFGADFGFNVGPGKLFFDARYLTMLGDTKSTKENDDGRPGGWEKDHKDGAYIRYAKLCFSVGYEFGGSK